MRIAKMVTLLVSILVLTMQCSDEESINNLLGSTEITSNAPDTMVYDIDPVYVFLDSFPATLIVCTDSIRWAYLVPSGGFSSTNVIVHGKLSWQSEQISERIKDNSLRTFDSLRTLDSLRFGNLKQSVRDSILDSLKAIQSCMVDVIIFGNTVLEVETYQNDMISTMPLNCNTLGIFIDTVQIAVTPPSEEMLTDLSMVMVTQGSRLFVKRGNKVLDSIPLDNPW